MSRDEWWRQASKEEQLAELERMRKAHSRRREELEARYPLLDVDGWMDGIGQRRSGPWQWAAAVSFVGLPLGHEGSGLVLLSTPSIGRLWWSARSGMFPILLNVEPKVELASGDADLTAKAAGSLWRACVAGERRGLADVESRCFDGISATVALHGCGGDRVKATCNVAEAGREPALVLARRLVAEMGKHRVFGWGACG